MFCDRFFLSSGGTERVNLFQSVNQAMDIALATDNSAGQLCCSVFWCVLYSTVLSCFLSCSQYHHSIFIV